MLTHWRFCFFVSVALAVIGRCEGVDATEHEDSDPEAEDTGEPEQGSDEEVQIIPSEVHGKMDADKDGLSTFWG